MSRNSRLSFLLGSLFVVMPILVGGASAMQVTTVFKGIPSIKISEGGNERKPEAIPRDRAVNLECVISRIGEDYYWASRENVPMVRIESGAFITFVAVNGSGYVRMIDPDMKKAAALMGETEAQFDY